MLWKRKQYVSAKLRKKVTTLFDVRTQNISSKQHVLSSSWHSEFVRKGKNCCYCRLMLLNKLKDIQSKTSSRNVLIIKIFSDISKIVRQQDKDGYSFLTTLPCYTVFANNTYKLVVNLGIIHLLIFFPLCILINFTNFSRHKIWPL